MSISQLSPGDKLSIKGKLFDLQKRLNIMEIEQQQQPEYTFHPEIIQYDLPARHSDFTENVRRAQEIRQEKMGVLVNSLQAEFRENCTFSPEVTRKAKQHKSTTKKPAYERLYEKGLDYKKSLDQRKEKAQKFDEMTGRKLFVPDLSSKVSSKTPPTSNVGVEEFLHRDAMERNERLNQLRESAAAETNRLANQSKLNKQSELMLKRKYERMSREAFEVLSRFQTPTIGDPSHEIELTLVNIQEAVRILYERDHWRHPDGRAVAAGDSDPYYIASLIWSSLDIQKNSQMNAIGLELFVEISVAALLSKKKGRVDVLCHFIERLQRFLTDKSLSISEKSELPATQENRGSAPNKGVQSNMDLARNSNNTRGTDPIFVLDDESVAASSVDNSINTSKSNLMDESQDCRSIADSMTSGKSRGGKAHNPSRISLLDRDSRSHEDRVELLRREAEAKEMEQCTFAPRLITKKQGYKISHRSVDSANEVVEGSNQSVTSESVSSVHERLYALKDKVPNSILLGKHRSLHEKELDGCTFAPRVVPAPKAPTPVFSDVSAVLNDLAPLVGVDIKDDGDIIFGMVPAVHGNISMMKPATINHKHQTDNKKNGTPSVSEPNIEEIASPSQQPKAASFQTLSSISESISESSDPPSLTQSFDRPKRPARANRHKSILKGWSQDDSMAAVVPDLAKKSDDVLVEHFFPERRLIGRTYDDFSSEIAEFASSLIKPAEDPVQIQPNKLQQNDVHKIIETETDIDQNSQLVVLQKVDDSIGENPVQHNSKNSASNQANKTNSIPKIPKGFEASVAKMRLSRDWRLRKEKELQDLGTFSEERYLKSRQLAAEGVKPFKFKTEDRSKRTQDSELKDANEQKRQPR